MIPSPTPIESVVAALAVVILFPMIPIFGFTTIPVYSAPFSSSSFFHFFPLQVSYSEIEFEIESEFE
jgi:hypothetical protein